MDMQTALSTLGVADATLTDSEKQTLDRPCIPTSRAGATSSS